MRAAEFGGQIDQGVETSVSLKKSLYAVGLVAALTCAASGTVYAVVPVQKCQRIIDPKRAGVKIRVDVAEGRTLPCTTARAVMRAYLKRVPVPRRSIPENSMDVSVRGRRWSCYVSRVVGRGPGWDFLCSTERSSGIYTSVGGGARRLAEG